MNDVQLEVRSMLLPDMISSIMYALVRNDWKAELSHGDNHMRISARRQVKLGTSKPLQCLGIEIATEPEVAVRYISVSRDGRHGILVQADHEVVPALSLAGMSDKEFDNYAMKVAWK